MLAAAPQDTLASGFSPSPQCPLGTHRKRLLHLRALLLCLLSHSQISQLKALDAPRHKWGSFLLVREGPLAIYVSETIQKFSTSKLPAVKFLNFKSHQRLPGQGNQVILQAFYTCRLDFAHPWSKRKHCCTQQQSLNLWVE